MPSEAESLEDPEVLMDVMELRENLEDASTEGEAQDVQRQNQGKYFLVKRPSLKRDTKYASTKHSRH